MKLKKTLAVLLALQMVLSSAVSVNAEEETILQTEMNADLTESDTGGGISSDEAELETDETEPQATQEAQSEETKNETESEAESVIESETETEDAEEKSRKARAAEGLNVQGGTLGTDYTYTNGVLTILTSTSLTISNKNISEATSDRIVVPVGVSANITLAGVNIKSTSGGSPLTLTPAASGGASAHIILADGTENTLTSGVTYYPGLRCGRGSSVTIDDSVLNQDSSGQAIVPELGRIPYDTTLANGTVVKKGERLTLLDSSNPGKLIVKGAGYASGLGGGNIEDGGNITINGGIINASTTDPHTDAAGNAGAGIGGGRYGGGGNITINGGTVTAQGAYHAAGIGGGWGSSSGNAASGALSPVAPYRSGNITINGGTSYSYGGDHGNAFGDGCYGGRPGCNLTFTVKVTGGTLLASGGTKLDAAKDLGGSKANVIITGGSLKAKTFQSIGGQVAYGDEAMTTQVFMTTINLSGDAWAKSSLVDSLKVTMGGVEKDYGLPANVDENGCLYLWLPNSGANKEVRATLSVLDADGEVTEMDPFFITDAKQDSLLKRYAGIDIPDDFFITEEKVYDGLPIETKDLSTAGILSKEKTPRAINDASKVTYTSQRLDEDGNEISEEEAKTLPIDAGTWQITMTSTQYSSDAEFSNSYWGHRGYYKSVTVTRAASKTQATYEQGSDDLSNKVIHLSATVRPADGEAKTCASPTGKVQFYVNGVAVGQPVELTAVEDVTLDDYHYSTATYDWTPSTEDVVDSAEDYVVTVKYIGDVHGVNYKSSEAQAEAEMDITPIEQETPITITDVTDGENPTDVTDKKIEKKFSDGPCTIQGAGGNSSKDFVYSSSDESIAEVDPVTGKITFKDYGEVTIRVTKPGNVAYEEKYEEVTYIILPDSPTADDVELEKTAENKTDPGERTQVSDIITYTIKAENKRVGSLWKEVVIQDCIPEGMELDTDSMYLVAPDGTETKLGKSCYDSTTRVLEVKVGDVRGGQKYELRFDVCITEEALNADIGNVAEATGKTPEGDDIDSATPTPVYPSDDDTPENGGVLLADPTPDLEKTAENKTHSGKETTISDVITYTIKVENKKENSVWENVAIRDRIPEGLNLDTNSMYLVKPNGEEIHVDASAYQSAERMISVYVGDVYGGEKYIFRFDVVILEEAIGEDIGNEAVAIGGNPSGNGGGIGGTGGTGGTGGSGSTGGTGSIWGGGNGWTGGYTGGPYTPGSPYFPEDDPFDYLDDGTGAGTDKPVYPWGDDETPDGGGVLPGNPEPELEKTVNNVTSKDGNTRQDDILVYEIELTNPKAGTLWKNVMIFDYLPDELELDVSSMILIKPDGSTSKVASNVYNAKTHMIKVPIAKLWGGETYILRYKAQVKVKDDGDGQKEIVNRAEATGENPDGTVSEAGKGPSSSASVKYPEVSKGVQTGDKTPVVMVVVICAVSVLVMLFAAIFIFKKKRK